eukprot:TRINITY_DN27913_c0_g1_i1.p1 TRINITY_DN27913_c0_g1~~TRINITY_DN27913_c0_g1_i1.p1  ORF type:complete len:525 (+),score=146.32 TRINITY_DN27913_c0_g1_i1:43-1575(+)
MTGSAFDGADLRIASRPRDARVLRVPRDFPSVQAAIMSAKDGDCVALSSGVHELKEPVCIDRDIHLIAGDEASDGVTLRLDTSESRLLRAATHMITVDCESCRIGSITLEHVGGKGDPSLEGQLVFAIWCRRGCALVDQCRIVADVHSAIGVSSEAHPTVSRCAIKASEYGVWVEEGSRCGVRVERCSMRTSRGVYFSDNTAGEVEQCSFEGCGTGVECLQHCDAVVSCSSFKGCSDAAIYCSGGARADDSNTVRIYGNVFEGCNKRGVVADGSRPEVTKNTFTECEASALEIVNRGKGKYIGNTVLGGAVGVAVAGESNPMFRRNAFEGCSAIGVAVSGSGSVGTFVANTFTDCPIGVEVREKANPTVVSNVISGSDTAMCFTDGGLGRVRSNAVTESGRGCTIGPQSDPILEQNEIRGCTVAVVVDGGRGSLMQNELLGSSEAALQLVGATGTLAEENTITGSLQEGVLATQSSNAMLRGNTIRGNKGAAVHCSEDSRATLSLVANLT